MKKIKIVQYNINGIRASAKLGLLNWLTQFDADIYCFQETRASEQVLNQLLSQSFEQLSFFGDSNFNESIASKYKCVFNTGNRAGYSGTAVLTKLALAQEPNFMLNQQPEVEGRTITLKFNNFWLVNSYVPNGANRLDFKLDYFKNLTEHLKCLAKSADVLLCSDVNICHNEIDLSHPKQCSRVSAFLPVERQAFSNLLSQGFTDIFRELNPTQVQYTWRSYQSRIVEGYTGWQYRFDYIISNTGFKPKITNCYVLDLPYSDHLPVVLELEIE